MRYSELESLQTMLRCSLPHESEQQRGAIKLLDEVMRLRRLAADIAYHSNERIIVSIAKEMFDTDDPYWREYSKGARR